MTKIKKAFLFLIHSLLLQKCDCIPFTKWQLWSENDVTFGTPIAVLESVPLMNCLLRCEKTAGCASAHIKKITSTCELSKYYPPDENLSANPRTGPHAVGTQMQVLSVNNGGIWGEWGNPEFCPRGTYASGYTMKMGPKDKDEDDDTGLNAIRLICSDLGGIDRDRVTSLEGPFGSWLSEERCTNGTYLVNFQLQVEAFTTEKTANFDNTCADYVKFHCRDFAGTTNEAELVLPPGYGFWGAWGKWSGTCGPNSAICGLSTRVEGDQGEGVLASNNDTALNDVVFYCCDVVY